MYSERLLAHFRNPRHAGDLPAPAIAVEVTNPACGDILRLSARVEGDLLLEARYKTRGCTASIASGDALCEWLRGKTRDQVEAVTAALVEDEVGGLPAESRHAAQLCVDAVQALVREWKRRGNLASGAA